MVSRYIDVHGLRTHVLEWGDAGAPDLLLVHGSGDTASTWTAVAESLQDRYHIVAPDLRGHGQTERAAGSFLLDDFVGDVVGLIEQLGLERPAYIGHSWGGNIGTVIAADYPELISAALLEDPFFWKMINAFVTSLVRQLAYLERTGRDTVSHEALGRMVEDNRGWALGCEAVLRRISAPTLVLVADIEAGGQMIAEEVAYHRSITPEGVEFRVWPGVGHLMHTARPAQFVAELEEFLRSTR